MTNKSSLHLNIQSAGCFFVARAALNVFHCLQAFGQRCEQLLGQRAEHGQQVGRGVVFLPAEHEFDFGIVFLRHAGKAAVVFFNGFAQCVLPPLFWRGVLFFGVGCVIGGGGGPVHAREIGQRGVLPDTVCGQPDF